MIQLGKTECPELRRMWLEMMPRKSYVGTHVVHLCDGMFGHRGTRP